MGNYYFVSSLLTPLEIGHTPLLPYEELEQFIRDNFSPFDYEKLRLMQELTDLENLRFFLKGEEIDPRGNLSEKDIKQALNWNFGYSSYVHEFLSKYDDYGRLRNFSQLFVRFFEEETNRYTGFTQKYLQFEREIRLLILAYRAKVYQKDLLLELQYEDIQDDFVRQLIAQKDAAVFEPPYGYEELRFIFEEHGGSPLKLHRAICEYRFNKIADLEEGDLFSTDRILGYMARLMIVENWLKLDAELGNEMLENMMKSTR